MSSLLPGNPFAVMANDALGCTPINAEDQLNLNTSAVSNATLALAYEQRTANLIALAQLHVSAEGSSVDLSDDVAEITERLGMRVGK
ncbi:hypothetical protein [Glutamicibacter arilaitensis]|uniref:hypothetical protein n=1 Tax=Glutamicibacter arilaitensis TaxID=256701 RepID=UPI00384DB02F